jgi:predicted Zn-dependent protease
MLGERRPALWPAFALGLSLATPAWTQEDASGFNLFSPEQDVQIGQRAAQEAERQLPLIRESRTDRLLQGIVARLARVAPGADYPYQVRLVNASDLNAFALPGGFTYVNRGLVENVRSEAELAGVLAHEIAHVALRHGTEQASKAYAAQAGLGLLGRLLGREGERDRQIVETVGGLGLSTVFLKFGRDAENEADRVGVRMMADAGYDPVELARFFELLQSQQRRDPGAVERFLSSHPSPGDRVERVRAAAGESGGRKTLVGGLPEAQRSLRGRPPARRMAELGRDAASN